MRVSSFPLLCAWLYDSTSSDVIFISMDDKEGKPETSGKQDEKKEEIIYGSWSPDDGIVLEWMGRAEGLSDEQ